MLTTDSATEVDSAIAMDPAIGVILALGLSIMSIILSAWRIRRTRTSHRDNFLKEYISQFFTNKQLSRTYHDLIYTYDDEKFNKIKIMREKENIRKFPSDKPVFKPFSRFQGSRGRKRGRRLYHPALFQGSDEERNLDTLLGYLNIIAYHYDKGAIDISDIGGSIGYHLSVVNSRAVIQEYFRLCDQAWSSDPAYRRKFGATPPFFHLRKLLVDIEKYNFDRAYKVQLESIEHRNPTGRKKR